MWVDQCVYAPVCVYMCVSLCEEGAYVSVCKGCVCMCAYRCVFFCLCIGVRMCLCVCICLCLYLDVPLWVYVGVSQCMLGLRNVIEVLKSLLFVNRTRCVFTMIISDYFYEKNINLKTDGFYTKCFFVCLCLIVCVCLILCL